MINNTSRQLWERLAGKQLDQQFIQRMVAGLQCSPFEAESIVQTIHDVYGFLFQCSPAQKPGQLPIQVLSVEAIVGQPLVKSPLVQVVVTWENPSEDLTIRQQGGIAALRQHRMMRICTETLQQGGLMTLEDLAFRIFNCGLRTLCRDLKSLRQQKINVPLRSTVQDLGRTLSHRRLIVEQWLAGKEYSHIARATYHSIPSVRNYVEKFKRVTRLHNEGFESQEIAFLARISQPLASEYLKLIADEKTLKHRLDELAAKPKKSPSMTNKRIQQ